MPEEKQGKKLPKGPLDPLNTKKAWKPQGVKEIFGTGADVFGLRKKKAKDEPNKKDEGEEESKADKEAEEDEEEDEGD